MCRKIPLCFRLAGSIKKLAAKTAFYGLVLNLLRTKRTFLHCTISFFPRREHKRCALIEDYTRLPPHHRGHDTGRRPFRVPVHWTVLVLLLILCIPANSEQEEIHDIYAEDYFPAVHEEFQNAKGSIVVTMYHITLDPNSSDKSPTYTLVRDLIDAHKRGVDVRVRPHPMHLPLQQQHRCKAHPTGT